MQKYLTNSVRLLLLRPLKRKIDYLACFLCRQYFYFITKYRNWMNVLARISTFQISARPLSLRGWRFFVPPRVERVQ